MANEPAGKGTKLVFYPRGALSERASIIRKIQALGEQMHALGNKCIEVRPIPGVSAPKAKAKKGKGKK
jgi:hypothetical protein